MSADACATAASFDGLPRATGPVPRAGRRRQAVDRRLPGSGNERTGIPKLKVGYNKVFGYYIEVSNAQQQHVPDEYIRKQTLKNAERYITPELKEYEEKVCPRTKRPRIWNTNCSCSCAMRCTPPARVCRPPPGHWPNWMCWPDWPNWPRAQPTAAPVWCRRTDAEDRRRPPSRARHPGTARHIRPQRHRRQ